MKFCKSSPWFFSRIIIRALHSNRRKKLAKKVYARIHRWGFELATTHLSRISLISSTKSFPSGESFWSSTGECRMAYSRASLAWSKNAGRVNHERLDTRKVLGKRMKNRVKDIAYLLVWGHSAITESLEDTVHLQLSLNIGSGGRKMWVRWWWSVSSIRVNHSKRKAGPCPIVHSLLNIRVGGRGDGHLSGVVGNLGVGSGKRHDDLILIACLID